MSADMEGCSGIVGRQETMPAGDFCAEARDWMAWDGHAALYLPSEAAHERIRQAARRAVETVPMMKPAAGCRLQVGGCRLKVAS